MLRSVNELRGLTIHATDDEIGRVDDFFFDDAGWSIRYMVVNTGSWMLPETVLISPRSIRTVDWAARRIEVNLTRQQVKDAPSTATDRPVSRQMELTHAAYYNYDPYWNGPRLWGGIGYPYAIGGVSGSIPSGMTPTERELDVERNLPKGDTHLRSTHEVTGYHIRASDGTIGHVNDFVMDDESWAVRYLVVDTRNWWPGKQVLIAPAWIAAVSWNDRTVDVDMPRATIKSGPAYDPTLLNRTFEEQLYRHYQRTAYWDETSTTHEHHTTPTVD